VSRDDPEPMRDALRSLRIERDETPRADRPLRLPSARWLGAGIAIPSIAAIAWAAWTCTGPAPVSVEVAYVSHGGSSPGPVLSGAGYVVTGDRYISLGARVPGRVTHYYVEEGESVTAGQALVQLDDRHYAAAVREAEASRRVAEAEAEYRRTELVRLRRLRAQDVASQAALDAREREIAVASAEVDRWTARIAQLRLDLEETVVRAPTDGIVLEKLKEVGEMAVPGGFSGSGELIRIANLAELRAEVDVNETDLAKVALGQSAQIVPDAYPSRRYAARVAKLYPQLDRKKGTLRVEARILSPDEMLRPDMSVRVEFLTTGEPATRSPVPRAPRAAIREDGEGRYVWSVERGRAVRRAVELGAELAGGLVEVRVGLEGGEALVLGEAKGIDETSPVRIAN